MASTGGKRPNDGGTDVPQDARVTRPFVVAALVHAAAVLALRVVPLPHVVAAPPAPRESESAAEIDIAADDEGETAGVRAPPSSGPGPIPGESEVASAARGKTTDVGRAPAAPIAEAERQAADTGPPAGDTHGDPAADGAPVQLVAPSLRIGLGSDNPFLARGALPEMTPEGELGPRRAPPKTAHPEAPTPAEAKRNAETALRAPARERERELGLGPEGPVLAALSEAAYATATAVKGRAIFAAVADASGTVIALEVVSCEGGGDAQAAWSEAARAALAALKGKQLRMPSTAKRAEMRLEVTSAWKLPTGHDPGADVDLFHIPLSKGEGKQSTKISVLDPIPKLRVDQLEISPGVKVPIVSVGVDVVNIQGDPAAIGAKPRRVVHSRLVESKFL